MGRSGNGAKNSRFAGRGLRSELARRGRGFGGRSGSPLATNRPGNTQTTDGLKQSDSDIIQIRRVKELGTYRFPVSLC